MDLIALAGFLETQEIGFTSILKNTKNIDPEGLKRVLIKHHAQMIMIAKGKYPIELTSPTPETPVKPNPFSSGGMNKRFFHEDSSDGEDTYEPPTKIKTSAGRYSYVTKPANGSSSASTPIKPKTSNPTASNPHSSPFDARGRMRPAGASNLFKTAQNFNQSPNVFKDYNVIDLSSGQDSEFEEAKEGKGSESDEIGSHGVRKSMPVSRGNTARRGGASRRGRTAPGKTLSKAMNTSAASKDFFGSPSDQSDDNIPATKKVKKGESSASQSKLDGKLVAKTGTTADEISSTRTDITALEKQLTEKQDQLKRTQNFLARTPILENIQDLKESIAACKISIGEGPKKRGRKAKVATVEDASEEEDDSLFVG